MVDVRRVTPPPNKVEVMRSLLERSEARVYLDARREGVLLPPHLRAEPQLRLDYSYSFHPPIADLVVNDEGIAATLSFNQRSQPTFIPWGAIYLIADYDGNGAVWQDDIPREVLERVAEALEKQPITVPATKISAEPVAPARPKLVAVPEGDGPPTTEPASPPPDPEEPRPRPALRLVK